jgi:hypothetical protein
MTTAPIPRLYPLRPHAEQRRYWDSPARFNVVPAGRRSGKTELAKRRGVRRALRPQPYPDAHYVFGAPTHQQAKRIFWRDIKAMVPRWALAGTSREAISEGELSIRLITGATIIVAGLDVPERIEGFPLDHIVIDEIGNCRQEVWTEHIRPALSERGGSADLIGVPEGRNHYYGLSCTAQEQQRDRPDLWGFFAWHSADILPPEEIVIARAELDELTFRQEYEAEFVTFEGRVYYAFSRATHAAVRLPYDPKAPLVLCFDFNVSPGVCAVVQELYYPGEPLPSNVAPRITAVVDEVYIPRNSNTKLVCRQIAERYGNHRETVTCYGDASGGAAGSAKVEGSDWDLIRTALKPVFGDRLRFRVPRANPKERVRVNAMNSRIENADGLISFLVDPAKCPRTILDFEGVTCKGDGSGDIDKSADSTLTHLSDAVGYYVAEQYPLVRHLSEWSYI